MIINVTDSIRTSIKNMRKERGFRGDKLSVAVGKSPSFISRIENGKTNTIDDKVLFSIFKIIMDADDDTITNYISQLSNEPALENQDYSYSEYEKDALFNHSFRQLADSISKYYSADPVGCNSLLTNLNIIFDSDIDYFKTILQMLTIVFFKKPFPNKDKENLYLGLQKVVSDYALTVIIDPKRKIPNSDNQ